MKRALKWLATLVVSLLLIVIGFGISLSVFPITERISSNACYIEDYETVFCQKGEDENFVYYQVLGVQGVEMVKIERKIPKKGVGRLDL